MNQKPTNGDPDFSDEPTGDDDGVADAIERFLDDKRAKPAKTPRKSGEVIPKDD